MAIINEQELMELLDGDLEFLQETFDMFCEESRTGQIELRTAVAAGDLKTVHTLAHSFKGMLSNFIAKPACETAAQIEAMHDADALAAAQPLLDVLAGQIETMKSEIRQILESAT